ncbi:HMG1/2-like protein isoform X1 [Ipomoea triloba]|uniref:HMG1/2-like protein isoform X1 n=1 Tax=Ipomoea triloba TaxID=35885 RepID=UPI00125D3640|nr:HMG1/2-like protein isoform X1 [Ipomoea triloba]XP_031105472.1 HMG1/2-like protein isoform X1 [Ipomoea triloba]
MKGLKATSVAKKKLDIDSTKKRKADVDATKKGRAKKKDSGAPKRPLTAFLLFMSDFRKNYKENFPDNRSMAIVGKAGGEKWKAMSDSEKAPYVAKASQLKSEYGNAMQEFKKNVSKSSSSETTVSEESEQTSEVKDNSEQEASC